MKPANGSDARIGDRRVTATRDEVDRSIEALRCELKTLIAGHDRLYMQRFNDSQVAVDAALNAQKEAVDKAETAAEKRFEGVNEFRAQLGDQQRTLMPRAECEIRFKAIETALETVAHAQIERTGQKAGAGHTWGLIAGVVGILIALLTLTLRFTGTR